MLHHQKWKKEMFIKKKKQHFARVYIIKYEKKIDINLPSLLIPTAIHFFRRQY